MEKDEKDVKDEKDIKEDNTSDVKEKKHLIENPVAREITSYVMVMVAAILVAYFITAFIISNNTVPTGSMVPTIPEESRIFGFRLAYTFSEPERGDIVIFKYPVDEKQYFVKRIIGLPGDKVEIHDGNVYINDEVLDESDYLDVVTEGNFGPYNVPDDSYFMMGDNRNLSSDSRYWKQRAEEEGLTVDDEHDYTFVKKDKIISKALIEYYPKVRKLY